MTGSGFPTTNLARGIPWHELTGVLVHLTDSRDLHTPNPGETVD